MMPEAQHQVTIARPIGEVFAFVADGLNGSTWRPGVLDIALVSGSGATAVYKQGVKGPGGRRIDADYRITAYEPDHRLSFEAIAGPVRPTGSYVFEDVGGGTRLTFSLRADLGGIKKLLMGGAVQKTMDAEVAATEQLKSILENG
jgi:carbon monoxide dehydrogenase subunit G